LGTRYGALLGIIYVVIATATTRLWWQHAAAQQIAQYTNLMENTAIIGGFVAIFVVVPGGLVPTLYCRKILRNNLALQGRLPAVMKLAAAVTSKLDPNLRCRFSRQPLSFKRRAMSAESGEVN
jgi:hypothetical protein